MSVVSIPPARLKSVRRLRKMGRPQLGKRTGLTERAVARLESEGGPEISFVILQGLAAALQVRPEVLTGEAAISPDEESTFLVEAKCRTGCCG